MTARFLPVEGGYDDQMRRWRSAIDWRLAELTPDARTTPVALVRAWEYAALAPGKRLRGLLVLATLEDLGANPASGIDAACAIELVHTASLIIDDLPSMDDARLRRGRATLHTVVGEGVAILTAIALLSKAFAVCAELPGEALSAALARAVGCAGLAAGQVRDIEPDDTSIAGIEATYRAKTGALFVAACEMATLLFSVNDATKQHLLRFADSVGLAFQANDDARDSSADASELGKDVRQDRHRATIEAVTNRADARRWFDAHLERASVDLAGLLLRGAVAGWLAVAFGPHLEPDGQRTGRDVDRAAAGRRGTG